MSSVVRWCAIYKSCSAATLSTPDRAGPGLHGSRELAWRSGVPSSSNSLRPRMIDSFGASDFQLPLAANRQPLAAYSEMGTARCVDSSTVTVYPAAISALQPSGVSGKRCSLGFCSARIQIWAALCKSGVDVAMISAAHGPTTAASDFSTRQGRDDEATRMHAKQQSEGAPVVTAPVAKECHNRCLCMDPSASR